MTDHSSVYGVELEYPLRLPPKNTNIVPFKSLNPPSSTIIEESWFSTAPLEKVQNITSDRSPILHTIPSTTLECGPPLICPGCLHAYEYQCVTQDSCIHLFDELEGRLNRDDHIEPKSTQSSCMVEQRSPIIEAVLRLRGHSYTRPVSARGYWSLASSVLKEDEHSKDADTTTSTSLAITTATALTNASDYEENTNFNSATADETPDGQCTPSSSVILPVLRQPAVGCSFTRHTTAQIVPDDGTVSGGSQRRQCKEYPTSPAASCGRPASGTRQNPRIGPSSPWGACSTCNNSQLSGVEFGRLKTDMLPTSTSDTAAFVDWSTCPSTISGYVNSVGTSARWHRATTTSAAVLTTLAGLALIGEGSYASLTRSSSSLSPIRVYGVIVWGIVFVTMGLGFFWATWILYQRTSESTGQKRHHNEIAQSVAAAATSSSRLTDKYVPEVASNANAPPCVARPSVRCLRLRRWMQQYFSSNDRRSSRSLSRAQCQQLQTPASAQSLHVITQLVTVAV